MMTELTMLAQGEMMLWITAIMVAALVFMAVTGRGRQKREKEAHEKMVEALGRNDKVVTWGGIVGVVVEARPDELVLKIDEANNTRVRLKKWAVRTVVREGEPADKAEK